MKRASYLQHFEQRLMIDWMRVLGKAFNETPYMVGSVLHKPDYRDVDVRIMLDDDVYDALAIDPRWLNLSLTLWGQKVTGLPIDCQVQRTTEANAEYGSLPRHALGISDR